MLSLLIFIDVCCLLRHLKYLLSLRYRLWAISSEVLTRGYEKIYCAVRELAVSTAICPTYAEGGERMWPWLREQGVLINMTGQCWNTAELLTNAKHISLLRSVRFLDPSASCCFLHTTFSKSISTGVTSKVLLAGLSWSLARKCSWSIKYSLSSSHWLSL